MLGASNLARSFPTAVSSSISALGAPLSVFAAMGHGRSFGNDSGCFGKKNSGIFFSKIWEALETQESLPTTAWITDIGNDLAYEIPVATILEWVGGCVDRLLAQRARVVVSDLSLNVLQRVSETQFSLFRAVLFPSCRLSRIEILDRAEQLSAGLYDLAKSKKTTMFPVKSEWYGWDPIHLRRAMFEIFWREMMVAADVPCDDRPGVERDWWHDRYLRDLRPRSWSQFSIPRSAPQPNGRLIEGSSIWLY